MIYIVLAISVPFLFLVGTVYNAIKAQKKLEDSVLKDILEKRKQEKEYAMNHRSDVNDDEK
ncbi:MAG: hypothetical protein IJ671_07145 [Succinivibrio sp.]|jgi:hypothetical protein|nr:hypothetical protein [Succinivibrio sp.]MBR1613287.1 hypothetical protein [Succinivibrio sp.]